jgi:predicted ArsR family transcriptional regulator
MSLDSLGQSQRALLHTLQQHKDGLTVDVLTEQLGISRNAVRQHLAALERLGWVARGSRRASRGRPEQLYVLSDTGIELFPRQYSWFSELLLQTMRKSLGDSGVEERLSEMGRRVGEDLRANFGTGTTQPQRVAAVTEKMVELGYDAEVVNGDIEARNCVFHQIAMKSPEVCRFDLAMLEAAVGGSVDHKTCMARGDACCRFGFRFRKPK